MLSASRVGGEAENTPAGDASESGPDGDAREGHPEPSLDVIFDVLQNRRRRLVLAALADCDDFTTLGDLAERIGGIENDKPPSSLDSQERKRVYVGLYQSHLPKMDAAGAIRFDDDRGTVEPGPHIDVFRTYLNRDDEGPHVGYYIGVVVASLLGFFVAVFVNDVVAALAIALLIVAVGIAGAHAAT